MNKKITSSVLAALLVAGSTSFSAFAAMANGTVVIGTKAFDLAYANNPVNAAEITNAVVAANGAIFVKDFEGNWINNATGLKVLASAIPAVTYKSATGVVSSFDAGDKDAITGLSITSVSAITKTGVTVTFPALTIAKTDATVTVLNNGVATSVTAKLLDVGETTATFYFVTALTADPIGSWKVDGVSYDANAQVAVKAVNDASDQINLLAAIKSSYFTGVNDAKIVEYWVAMNATSFSTIAEVQKAITDVNTNITGTATVKAVVDALIPTTVNEATLLTALKNSNFTRVNANWIHDYAVDVAMNALTTSSTVVNVQTAIDTLNATKVSEAITAVTGLDKTALAAARTLVEAYVPATTDAEKLAKAAQIKNLNIVDAIIKVNDAQTKASIKTALTNLAALDATLTVKINDTILSDYIAALVVATPKTTVDQTSEINTMMTNVLAAKTITAISGLTALAIDATNATVKAAFQYLADVTATSSNKFDMLTINDLSLSAYRDVVRTQIMADVNAVNTRIAPVNVPTAGLTAIDNATDSTTLLAALKTTALNLTNVIDANKAAYATDLVKLQAAANPVGTPLQLAASVSATAKVIDAVNATVLLNSTTTAANAKVALTSFAIATANSDYLNLSSTAKLEVAELVLNAKPVAGFADIATVTASVGVNNTAGKMAAYVILLDNVNKVATDTNTEMVAELGKIGYATFDNLSAARQIDVAEKFLAAFPMTVATSTTPSSRINYTSLAAIKTAIDVAIAK